MISLSVCIAVCFVLYPLVNAILPDGRPHANMPPHPALPRIDFDDTVPVSSQNGTQLPPYSQVYYFLQPIDHDNPSLGTFHQRYWFTYEFYEPGGPIVLMTPGEVAADGYTSYLTNKTVNGMIAQQQKGATVVLEHRFFGMSNPHNDLSEDSFKLLTIQQAIDDLAYFAQNVQLPMPYASQATADKAPWILVGGSYSGALVSWTMVNKPGVFYAGYASSAVVQSITDYWAYFDPIRQFMPQNCSADVQAVIEYIDSTFQNGTQAEINAVKSNFGLGPMTHFDDVAGALRNNLWTWQSLQPTTGDGAPFFEFCDALEVKNGQKAGASGWGLQYALSAWGKYWNQTYYNQLCGGSDPETCLGTYDSSSYYFINTVVDNAARSWEWITCNEVGFYQSGAPTDMPTISTRLIQPSYDERQCSYWFPNTFTTPASPNVNKTNSVYQGWDVSVDRLFFANGQRDPWRDATVSSDFITRQSTSTQPISVGDGFHCSDLLASSGTADSTIHTVQAQALSFMKTWLSAYKPILASTRREVEERGQPFIKPVNAWSHGAGIVSA